MRCCPKSVHFARVSEDMKQSIRSRLKQLREEVNTEITPASVWTRYFYEWILTLSTFFVPEGAKEYHTRRCELLANI